MKMTRAKTGRRLSAVRRVQAAVLLLGCTAFGYAFTMVSGTTPSGVRVADTATAEENSTAQDYSKFQHSNPMHSRMPCLLCHVRAEGLTTPRFPGHMPCASCHVQQFADNKSPMCNICHTPTGVKPFPPLRSFDIRFDHGRHLRQTSCATCHKPSRRGVALSVPAGRSGHATCFQCHGPRTEVGGRNIGSCGTCHQPGRPVRGSDSARAFSFNFNHAEHTGKGRMNCAACHTVRAGMARGRQVSSPVASMHFSPPGAQSCGNCHNSKRAFGTGDFANCKRCHEGKTFKF